MTKIKTTLIVGAAILLAACGATRPTSEWRDTGFKGGPFRNLLVIGVTDEAPERRRFEDAFVGQLARAGTTATASWTVMAQDTKVSKESVIASVAGQDVDAVLVSHLVGVEDRELYHPPRSAYAPARHGYGYYRYYSSVYDYVYDPGYSTQYTLVKLETNLYDRATEALVWSMQSETIDPETASGLVDSLAQTVIGNLRKAQLLTAP